MGSLFRSGALRCDALRKRVGGHIRWTSESLGAPAGRFPPLDGPVDLRTLWADGDAVDGPAAAAVVRLLLASVRGAAVILWPRPVLGGMVWWCVGCWAAEGKPGGSIDMRGARARRRQVGALSLLSGEDC